MLTPTLCTNQHIMYANPVGLLAQSEASQLCTHPRGQHCRTAFYKLATLNTETSSLPPDIISTNQKNTTKNVNALKMCTKVNITNKSGQSPHDRNL